GTRIRLASGRFAIRRDIQPSVQIGQRTLASPGWLEVAGLRQGQRQLFFRQGLRLAIYPENGKGLSPVALAGEEPVPQFVINRLATLTLGFQPGGDFRNRIDWCQSIDRNASATRMRFDDLALF